MKKMKKIIVMETSQQEKPVGFSLKSTLQPHIGTTTVLAVITALLVEQCISSFSKIKLCMNANYVITVRLIIFSQQ